MRTFIKVVGLVTITGALLTSPSFAQKTTQSAKSPIASTAANETPNITEAERLRNARRQQARSLLISLATEARSFRGEGLRARTLTRIAELLWSVDNEQARELFRRAWEAAEVADRDDKGDQNFREQVLTPLGRLDRRLAEEFLQKMKEEQERAPRSQDTDSNMWELDQAAQHRLDLAKSLLRAGQIEQALQFADPILNRATISTLDFLTDLRDQSAAEADRLYGALLTASGNNVLSDANTVSLLSSYLFSPQTYFVFNPGGTASWAVPRVSLPAPNVTPQLRLAFFQTAATILSRPQSPPDQDQTTTGVAGKYMLLKRLLPLFDSLAPGEIAAAMHSQFETLSLLVNEDLRNKEDESSKKGIGPEKSVGDQEQPLLEEIEHAQTSAERDELYFRLAVLAAYRDDPKARVYVGKIEESDFRKRAQAWIDWELTIAAVEKKKTERALELIRVGELNHEQRVWLLTQTAKLLTKTDSARALALTEEASEEARRIDGGDPARPGSLLAVAGALQLLDASRVCDALFEAVKAANSAEGFTGEKGAIKTFMNSQGRHSTKTQPISDFDVRGIFEQVARSDYDRAIELASGFRGEAARANATIAIARAVLNEAVSTKSPAQKPLVR